MLLTPSPSWSPPYYVAGWIKTNTLQFPGLSCNYCLFSKRVGFNSFVGESLASIPSLLSWKPGHWQLGMETRTRLSSFIEQRKGWDNFSTGGGDLTVDLISLCEGTATQKMLTERRYHLELLTHGALNWLQNHGELPKTSRLSEQATPYPDFYRKQRIQDGDCAMFKGARTTERKCEVSFSSQFLKVCSKGPGIRIPWNTVPSAIWIILCWVELWIVHFNTLPQIILTHLKTWGQVI